MAWNSSLPPVGPKRARMREKLDTFGGLSDWLRQGVCLLRWEPDVRCWGDVVPAHLDARGMGGGRGDWLACPECQGALGEPCDICGGHGKVANVTRLCQGHHLEWDRSHEDFQRRYGLDVYGLARKDGIWFLDAAA